MEYVTILFYKYVRVEDPKTILDRERAVCAVLGLTGRVIVAKEGINATLEGVPEAIEKYIKHIQSDKRFKFADIKKSRSDGRAFPKLSIKVRSEIVASGLGDTVKPQKDTGVHLAPTELKKWFEEGKDFEIIDMRNDYEYAVGHFRNSRASGMENFRDLQKVTPAFAEYKEKPVVTVCTGGVRCEKASAYLKTQGFKEVYQLDGGIHTYMEQFPGEDFLGTLYTFDGRVTMDFGGDRTIVGHCIHCNESAETYADCAIETCGNHFVACDSCRDEQGKAYCPKHHTISIVQNEYIKSS